VFAFQNKIIIFQKWGNSLTIMDDPFNLIGTVTLYSNLPLFIIRIGSSIYSGALECIDELNNKFPAPILENL
jgi:hypothetical protein